jgi:catalase
MNTVSSLSLLSLCAVLAACGPGDSGLELGEEHSSPDEAANTAEMIDAIKIISLARYPTGVIERFNQSKTLGCFDARLTVPDDLDPSLQQGVFVAGVSYLAQLRFASATQADDRDKDFHGLSIKVLNTPGEPLWGEPGQQDFLFNSYPALFAADPGDFLDFIEATRDGQVWRYFINPAHFYSLGIVLKGREEIENPFAIDYWSTTPYRFGNDPSTAVKYSVRPCSPVDSATTDQSHKDFLTDVMQDQLQTGGACFDFMVQFQRNPDTMPIEDAAVIWDESVSPFIKVASIHIGSAATSKATADRCEAMTFNPWQSQAEHRPLGGINRTRKPIYSEIGQFRGEQNRLRGVD